MNKRWFRALFRQRVMIILLLVLQVVFLVWLISSSSRVSVTLNRALTILSLLAVLSIVAKKDKGAYKTTWVFLILSMPLFGGLLYLLFNFQTSTRRFAGRLEQWEKKAAPLYLLPGDGYDQARAALGHHFPQVRCLQDGVGFPIYANTQVEYLTPGERMLEELLKELKKAERYIFLEFFIVQEGVMWDSVLAILALSIPRRLSAMTASPRWEPPIWIFAACISILNAARWCFKARR